MQILDTINALEVSARNRSIQLDNIRVQQAASGTPAQYLPPSGKSLRAQADDLKSLHQALAVLWRDAHRDTAAAAALVATLQQLKLPSGEAQELLVRPRPTPRPQRASSSQPGGSVALLPQAPPTPKWGDTLRRFLRLPLKPTQAPVQDLGQVQAPVQLLGGVQVKRLPCGPMPTEQMVQVTERTLPSWMHWAH